MHTALFAPKPTAGLIAIVLIALSLIAPAISQAADASQCGFIKDPDRRNYCTAKAKQQQSYCGFIRDQDLRNFCTAEVKRDRSYCGFISNPDKRNECRASI